MCPGDAHPSLPCALERVGWNGGGSVRRALQAVSTDVRVALGSHQTDRRLRTPLTERNRTAGAPGSSSFLILRKERKKSRPRTVRALTHTPHPPWGSTETINHNKREDRNSALKREGRDAGLVWLSAAGPVSLVRGASAAMLLGGDGSWFVSGGG